MSSKRQGSVCAVTSAAPSCLRAAASTASVVLRCSLWLVTAACNVSCLEELELPTKREPNKERPGSGSLQVIRPPCLRCLMAHGCGTLEYSESVCRFRSISPRSQITPSAASAAVALVSRLESSLMLRAASERVQTLRSIFLSDRSESHLAYPSQMRFRVNLKWKAGKARR